RTRNQLWPNSTLSSAAPEKSCVNPAAPSAKAIYSWVTDSGPVSRGNGEKSPDQGSDMYLKPCAYDRSERIYCVTACLLHNEPTSCSCPARLTRSAGEPERKRVLIGRVVGRGRRETL